MNSDDEAKLWSEPSGIEAAEFLGPAEWQDGMSGQTFRLNGGWIEERIAGCWYRQHHTANHEAACIRRCHAEAVLWEKYLIGFVRILTGEFYWCKAGEIVGDPLTKTLYPSVSAAAIAATLAIKKEQTNA